MGFAHTHLKPFEKGFKNSKTFIEEGINVQPRVCEQRAPSVVLVHESFAPYPCLGCDITLHGKVSPTDGKVLPRAARYHHPIGSTMLLYRGIRKSWCEDKSFRGTKSEFQAAPQVPTTLNPLPIRVTFPRYNHIVV